MRASATSAPRESTTAHVRPFHSRPFRRRQSFLRIGHPYRALRTGGARHPEAQGEGRRNTSLQSETETEKVRPGSACDAFAWSAAGNGACGAATWKAIRGGCRAAVSCGVSPPVGGRWFRERWYAADSLAPRSARYLSFAEREEIAILTGAGCVTLPVGSGSPVDCLARAVATRRLGAASGVSGVDCAVAQRPTCQAPEDPSGRERWLRSYVRTASQAQ